VSRKAPVLYGKKGRKEFRFCEAWKGDEGMLKMQVVRACSIAAVLAATSMLSCSKTQAPTPAPAPQPAPKPAPAPVTPGGLLSTQGEFPGITVAVQELKRSSNTLTLKLVMANQSSQSFPAYYDFFEKEGHSVDGVHLIDPVGKKKYFVVRDTDGACLCSRQIQDIAPGAQSVLWAKFPAPPDDVQKMTVEIPHFPPLEDVPISR
jgi:hypothetical protein